MPLGESRRAGIPSIRCTAKTRRGEQCLNAAIVGTTLCRMHRGHAPQILRKANERVTFAQLLLNDPRPIAEVLLDATHNADAAMQDARLRLLEGQEVTLDQLDRLLELSRLAHHLAKVTVDAGVEVALVNQAKVDVSALGGYMADVLLTVLNAIPLHPAWRQYYLARAQRYLMELGSQDRRLFDAPAEPLPPEPVPPQVPILLADPRAIP